MDIKSPAPSVSFKQKPARTTKHKSQGRQFPWLAVSIALAVLAWTGLSILPATADSFPSLIKVAASVTDMVGRGVLVADLASSLRSVVAGFLIAFALALPVAIAMAWYKPVERIIGPWMQFIRSIPPLAYVPVVVVSAGVGAQAQIIVIVIATFLVMALAIYQGVENIDPLLIKAARVLGARDRDIFVHVVTPAIVPSIVTALRLGATTALTTLIAAESTGAEAGLGLRIQTLGQSFETAPMMLYIIIIGIIGIGIDQSIRVAERKLTKWQDKR